VESITLCNAFIDHRVNCKCSWFRASLLGRLDWRRMAVYVTGSLEFATSVCSGKRRVLYVHTV